MAAGDFVRWDLYGLRDTSTAWQTIVTVGTDKQFILLAGQVVTSIEVGIEIQLRPSGQVAGPYSRHSSVGRVVLDSDLKGYVLNAGDKLQVKKLGGNLASIRAWITAVEV